jgi:DNA-binding CsgD family transcriptional regulator
MHPTGIILLGRTGQVVLMNRAASALVLERDGLLATRTGLRAEQPAESSLLEKTIRQAALTSNGHGISAGGTVIISRRARPPLQIRVSPIRNSPIGSEAVAAIVFVTDPLQRLRPTNDVLRGRFGLTPAEGRVALLLSDGHAPRKIANMIGITDNTVRSQIKSIFSKTGVKRQGELIRLLLSYSVAIPGERPAF